MAKNKYRDKKYDGMERAVSKGMKKMIGETAKEQAFSSKNSYVAEAYLYPELFMIIHFTMATAA